jgi:hypothetical protein
MDPDEKSPTTAHALKASSTASDEEEQLSAARYEMSKQVSFTKTCMHLANCCMVVLV